MVDAANVVGARPDGWWRDRAASADRLLEALATAVDHGAHPELSRRRVVVVLEGRARSAGTSPRPAVEVVRAGADGDTAVVDVVRRERDPAAGGADVVVVTSDRELRRRVEQLGASVRGAGWLRDLLDGTTT